jgi:hypothetical protein
MNGYVVLSNASISTDARRTICGSRRWAYCQGLASVLKKIGKEFLPKTGEFAVSIAPFTRITKYTQLQNIVIQYFFRNFAATKTKGFAKNKKGVCFTLVFSVGNYHFQKIVQKNNIVVSVCFNNSECEMPQTEEQI